MNELNGYKVEILTIFPEIFSGFLEASLIGKAIERKLLEVTLTNIRDYSDPPHRQVDDAPYGGGAGMLMRVEPLVRAIEAAQQRLPGAPVIFLTPSGSRFTQRDAESFSRLSSMIILCGRYEGVDQRVVDLFVDYEISLGDFVVMGGEVPAMAVIEAAVRLRDNVIGNSESLEHESFSPLLQQGHGDEAPHYSRPENFRGARVPEVLLSGDHKKIAAWRLEQSTIRTRIRNGEES